MVAISLRRTLLAAALLAVVPSQVFGQFWGAPVRDERRTFARSVCSWHQMQQRHLVMQQSDFSCGAASLATIARYFYGEERDERYFLEPMVATLSQAELEDRIENGFSMTDLRHAAVSRGYLASIGRRRMEDLYELRAPVIVRVVVEIGGEEHEHFVVVRGVAYDRVFLADPIRGNLRVPIEQFAGQWEDGSVLAIVRPGMDLPTTAPLLLDPSELNPIRPELQTIQRYETLWFSRRVTPRMP